MLLGKQFYKFVVAGGSSDRNVVQIKGLWKRLVIDTKKKVTQEKKERRKTGGGLFESFYDPITERVRSILPGAFFEAPQTNLFDDDADHVLDNQNTANENTAAISVNKPRVDVNSLLLTDYQPISSCHPSNLASPLTNICNTTGTNMKEMKKSLKSSTAQDKDYYYEKVLKMAELEHQKKMEIYQLKINILQKKYENLY